MATTALHADSIALTSQFNSTEDPTTTGFCFPRLFEQVAERYPNDTAVICHDNTRIAYEPLNSHANQIARVLVERWGVRRGDRIGVALNRSIDLILVLLAVSKAGAVYVPIDPAFPPDRVAHMMEDAQPKVVVVSDRTRPALSAWQRLSINIDVVRGEMHQADSSNLTTAAANMRPDDLAYIIYTSGSTGRPKGVEANHGALCNLLLSMQRELGCGPGDRLLAVASISFDMSLIDMLLPLATGAATVIAFTEILRDPGALVELMQRHAVTMIQATPSFWQMLLDGGWHGQPRLAKILTAGEPISRRLLDRLLASADMVWNGYGPTEATVYASVGRVSRDEQDIVIGRPIANFQLYVLHPEDLSPVSLGEIGELYIGGYGVNCGYRNKPDLTRERFLDRNPFHPGRLYRTGDLARFLAPDKLSLVGRTDSQVKLRGYRIELDDVSEALAEHAEVSVAVVLPRNDQLVAYFVRHHGGDRQQPPLDYRLREWLAQRRPAYMLPAFLIEMDAFPMTLNGKVDRKALPDPMTQITAATTIQPQPQTEMQRRVRDIWSQVLGYGAIGIDDNFFQVGGNSLRLARVKADLEKALGRSVQMAKLFEHYTIKTLAAYLEGSHNSLPFASQTQHAERNPLNSRSRLCRDTDEDIAIVSMACRLPGGISSPDQFWELLETGEDVITEVPSDRWDANALYDADPGAPGKSYCRRGGFIVDGVSSFDAPFFGISPREARTLDPTQAVMLETCWEGLERAGCTTEQLRGSQTGVFIGHSQVATHSVGGRDLADLDGYAVTGSSGAVISGRISYTLGLEGPSLTVDTACSSSLVSTHLACTSLRQRECDMAVAGGVSLMLSPGLLVEFSRLQGISPDGTCRAFDTNTKGTGFSEGAAVLVLKRLSDARRDGDTIQAVLRGSALNHGGRRAATLTTPSSAAQVHLIRTALKTSGLKPRDIDYIEAHGTATKLGDPIEGTALAEVFSDRPQSRGPLWIGSSKSNLGHTQAAAGLMGVLKVVLAMQHQILPKTLHVTKPTPLLDWRKANMALVLENRAWQSSAQPRRAGVSSFGIGGTNAHIIVEEAPSSPIAMTRQPDNQPSVPVLPFLVSGQSEGSLRRQVQRLHQHLTKNIPTMDGQYLSDVAYSLASRRTQFQRRLVVLADDEADLLQKLTSCSESRLSELPRPAGIICSDDTDHADGNRRLAMLFTGQGSQLLGMSKELYQTYQSFRDALDEVTAYFSDLKTPLLEAMWADPQREGATLLDRTDYAQPAIFAVEVALWRLWQSWGVQPQAVLGHSVGELVATHVAGVLDLPDACRLVAARGHLMQSLVGTREGSMASLEATSVEVAEVISLLDVQDKVDIAAYNTPTQTVVSGDRLAVEEMVEHFDRHLGRKARKLNVTHAFHSSHMDDMLPAFRAVLETLHFRSPTLPVVSSVTGLLAEDGQLEQPEYWVQQVRQAVRFRDGIQTLYHKQEARTFLEVGPQPILLGLAAACLAADKLPGHDGDTNPVFLPSLITGKRKDISVVLRTLAELHVRHVPIDWSAYFQPWHCRMAALPTYAFQRQQWFSPPRAMHAGLDNHIVAANEQTHKTTPSKRSSHFQFEIGWQYLDDVEMQQKGSTRSWGLYCPVDDGPWTSHIVRILSQAGIQLSRVKRLEEAQSLDGLICLWEISPHSDIPQQSSHLTAHALAQLQTIASTGFQPPVVWVTCQAVGIGNHEGDSGPETQLSAGPLWGLMRTSRNEYPDLRLRLIDIDQKPRSSEALALALTLSSEPECAVRQGKVLIPRLQQVESLKPAVEMRPAFLRQDGAVLITGGLGGIGRQVARWLASTHHIRDLVLISRRGMKDSGAQALVEELSQLGSRGTVIACDVANFNSLKVVMAEFGEGRPLRGVVHAAGVVDNGVLSTMTPGRCTTTLKPKVNGAWNLHLLTRVMDLDVFVMFSSIAGVLGMPGLGNYAAANSFLDALAQQRRAQRLPATSIAYGVWEGAGMATGLTGRTTLTHLAKFGLDPLKAEQGLKLFEQAVLSGRALTVAAALDLRRLRTYLQNEYAERGGIPSFYRELLSEPGVNGISGKQQRKGGRDEQLRTALSRAPAEQHQSILLAMVRETVAEALGFASGDQVDVDAPLQDIGFDSLTAVLLRNRLSALTGLKALSAGSIIWKHPNLKSLSHFLLSQLQSEVPRQTEQGNGGSLSPTKQQTVVNGMTHVTRLAQKGYLEPSITFQNTEEKEDDQRPSSVFITGATGFVGAFILHEILELGIVAHCLVRADGIEHGTQRLVAGLAGYDLWKPDYAPFLIPVVGDAAKPRFGLTDAAFDDLASCIDAICHSSALVDWMRPLRDYIGPNVVSAHEVLRLASRGRQKAVHVISTLATLPIHMGFEVPEHDREYGYSTSKYMAERMVAAARWRGAKASVYRVPFVAASGSTGHFRADRGDFLHNLIAGSIQLGSFPSLDADLSVVQPVDYLSKTIVAIMVNDRTRIGQDFDFVNRNAVSCNHFFKLLGDDDAGSTSLLPFDEWQAKALAYAAVHPKRALGRIAAVIDGLPDANAAAAMLKGLPTGQHTLGSDIYPAPQVDKRLARCYRARIDVDSVDGLQSEEVSSG
ncbi:polyketide synthase [Aspergillus indologenus CBS 114.80]|uniref:Polyketide synthase n=1 Tax=Aspergillus indologenus CBS 114.80 TaxID=1450541 RepID=A0A2V5HVI2_9EURO|nr:polyketide synthase [Aspergillus indologenus CBS 114.80]